MNKSCFAFWELNLLSSVQQIWKKLLFLKRNLKKEKRKKKGESPKSQWVQLLPQEALWNWSSVLSHNYKHFLLLLIFHFYSFISFRKLTFGPDWNSLLFYNWAGFLHWYKYFHTQINFFHILQKIKDFRLVRKTGEWN